MLRKSLMPLRVITGDAIPIEKVSVSGRSVDARSLTVRTVLRNSPSEILADPQYATYFPTVSDETHTMAEPTAGMAAFPFPSELPSESTIPFASFFAFGLPVKEQSGTLHDISRKLWVEIDVQLPPRRHHLVGGVLFSGLPYLPYDLTERGEITSNFGLPREIRVSWSTAAEDGFIDAESSLTDQAIASHGGLHILPTGPVVTEQLRLRFADFPRFFSQLDPTTTPPRTVQFWGFVIPLFYVFEHAEKTRYRPSVSGGMLAAEILSENQRLGTGQEASLQRNVGLGSSRYATFSAASLFRPHRHFQLNSPDAVPLLERFISKPLKPGQEVRIYFEQCEEYERCLAGLRLSFSDPPGPGGDLLNPPVRVSVYELDPLDGESPLLLDLSGKYANLLFAEDIDPEAHDGVQIVTLRFVRVSSARCFALVLRNRADHDGTLMMHGVELVQSADVVVAPRQSRAQTIRALHMRMIGPELAEDYCQIGSDSFTLSVERLVAGAKKEVLFSAESLLDMLQSGMARMYTNQRRRATEVEKVTLDTRDGEPSYEVRRNRGGSTGWRRSESGEQVDNFAQENLSAEFQDWRGEQSPFAPSTNNLQYGFSVFGNQESRLHSEYLFPRNATGNEWQAAATWINGLIQVSDLGALLNGEKLIQDSFFNSLIERNWQRRPPGLTATAWEPAMWRGLEVPDVLGLQNVTISPFSPVASLGQTLADLQPLARDAVRLMRRFANGANLDIAAMQAAIDGLNALSDLLRTYFSGPFAILNSSTQSVSMTPFGLGVSLSVPSSFPSIVSSSSVGSTGSISTQAFNTGYNYAQQLSSGFEEGTSQTDLLESTMKRIITRSAFPEEKPSRIGGAEVMWQQQVADILTASIPLNITLPATAGRTYRTSDDSIRVRFGNSVRPSVSVDVWFDVVEEVIAHDY